ncbi:MAG: hypothetical protein PHN39_03735 [Candidatus Pacebacteria bacterium]|jgi:hypothetical protein|nr:hypothetical protein [Candidatus Paceibacterota bacterium]
MEGFDWTGLVTKIASQGLLGVLLVFVTWAYLQKDKKISELRDKMAEMQEKRFQDVVEWKDEAIRITNKVNDVVDTLTQVLNSRK